MGSGTSAHPSATPCQSDCQSIDKAPGEYSTIAGVKGSNQPASTPRSWVASRSACRSVAWMIGLIASAKLSEAAAQSIRSWSPVLAGVDGLLPFDPFAARLADLGRVEAGQDLVPLSIELSGRSRGHLRLEPHRPLVVLAASISSGVRSFLPRREIFCGSPSSVGGVGLMTLPGSEAPQWPKVARCCWPCKPSCQDHRAARRRHRQVIVMINVGRGRFDVSVRSQSRPGHKQSPPDSSSDLPHPDPSAWSAVHRGVSNFGGLRS
jgi:hypothetical protein